ncbi:MAG: hypothetical protein HYR60_02310 [Acidobacteria bacterium]|nr:hypothetical protein [Acidobacteriota bacterium]
MDPPVAAQSDPNVLWRIGEPDGSGDEFGLGSAPSLTYVAGKSSPKEDWRESQAAAADGQGPVYRIQFRLDDPPAEGAVLETDLYFLSIAPATVNLTVNGKRGRFRLRAAAGDNADERQANTITYSRASLRMPVPHLRQGDNEIGLSFQGEGGLVRYDYLALMRSNGDGPELDASVEPTIYYRRRNGQMREITEVVLRHRQPLGTAAVGLRVAGQTASAESPADGYDFGERVVEVEAPVPARPAPYELSVNTRRFHGEFVPQKRWRIFAGLKIHNDIGYTDLQPNVQELDNRNTDGVLDLVARFPFYKFNFETSWLVENYLQSRKPARAAQLMKLAAQGQVGVNSMYLNVMTGLCTGEEMYRLLYYSKGLQRKYGVPLKFACLTDAPSHTWFVPTLLQDAGVDGFANGSNQTRAPLLQNSHLNEDSPFYWEGPDGRRVLTWFARSYLQFNRLTGDKPSLDRLHRTVGQFLARYRRADYPVDAVLLYGLYTDNADIGNGDAQLIQEWNEAYEFPKIVPATDADYYAYLARHFAGKLPVYRGDAGAYWEDGAGSTAQETILNRDTQRLLPVAEMASALATAFDPAQTYPAAEFREAWKNLLFYDEHTCGAHNSVRQPDRQFVTSQWEHKRAYAWRAHWSAQDLISRSFNRLVQNISMEGRTLFVFNPDLWPRTDVVPVELEPNREMVDLDTGKPVAADVVKEKDGVRRLRILAENVPGLGYKAYGVRPANGTAPSGTEAEPVEWRIESRYYRVAFNPRSGAIAQLVDKEAGRDLVDASASFGVNELLYVSGGENSRILQDLRTLPAPRLAVTGSREARILESVRTPHGRRIRIQSRAQNVPVIESEVTIYDTLKRVDIVNRIRKEETRTKEAVYFAFPFRISPPELAYQVQNAWVRPNQDQLPGACRDWFTTQNLVRARDGGLTIAWATPDAPLITLTGINRGLWLKDLEVKNGHVFSYAMNNYWFTNYKAAQGGEFTFRYFITSGNRLSEEELARFDAETRSPLACYPRYDLGNERLRPSAKRMPATAGSFFDIQASHAQVSAFKEAEDGRGYILRLRETAGRPGQARLASPIFPLAAAHLANGVEEDRAALPVEDNRIDIPLQPRAFTTVRLLFKP